MVGWERSAPCLAVTEKKDQDTSPVWPAKWGLADTAEVLLVVIANIHVLAPLWVSIQKCATVEALGKKQFIILFECDSRNPSH